jgi:hypothetical protein
MDLYTKFLCDDFMYFVAQILRHTKRQTLTLPIVCAALKTMRKYSNPHVCELYA